MKLSPCVNPAASAWSRGHDAGRRGKSCCWEPCRIMSLGRRLRRSAWAVQSQRTALKIPPFKPRAKWRAWKPSELILLRRLPAAEAARRLKRSLGSVGRQRWRLGMARYESRRWSRAEDKWLGRASDRKIARRLGRTRVAVRTRAGTSAFAAPPSK